MRKDLKIIIILGVAINFILGISGILFFNFYFAPKHLLPSPITGDRRIDRIILNYELLNFARRGQPPPSAEELKLVNLVHIKKKNSGFEISCQFGPLYYSGNLEKFYPEELISLGRIKTCDERTAKLIDEIAKNSKKDCRLPLTRPIPPYLDEYYMVAVGFKTREITPEIAEKAEKIDPCLAPLKNLIGEKIPHVFVGIVDPVEPIFYP